jgi:hypothetical protein
LFSGRKTDGSGGGDAYGEHKVDIAYHHQKGIIKKAKGEMLLAPTKLGSWNASNKRKGMAKKAARKKRAKGGEGCAGTFYEGGNFHEHDDWSD